VVYRYPSDSEECGKDWAQRAQAERRQASDTFQALCAELWHDPDASFIRRCIINEKELPDISFILAKRNATALNTLTRPENDIIEKIDRFCFLLVRMKACAETGLLTDEQRRLWTEGREDFWLMRMKGRRPEYLEYVQRHWPELGQDVFGIQLQPSEAGATWAEPPRPVLDHDFRTRTWRVFLF
jgi:hypothetical protein